jgi:hypothetical protein
MGTDAMTSASGRADSDSVNLGSNPSSPATQNIGFPEKTTPGHPGHPGQTAHSGRTEVGTARVLVCGGRNFADGRQLRDELCDLVWCRGRFKGQPQVGTIIHGCASGADRLAGAFAMSCGLAVVEFPAEWAKYGNAAGPLRNQQMLDEGKPDLVIAFHGGLGTQDMIRRANKAGVPVISIGAAPDHTKGEG